MKKYNVMIIEDDFRIAGIHQEMIEKDPVFTVINRSLNASDALQFLQECGELPSLILLDIYIPDTEGLLLLEDLRKACPYTAIIIASAANDRHTIQHAKLIGAFDYIIKPIEQKRLKTAFNAFKNFMDIKEETLSQAQIDSLFLQSHLQQNTQVSKEQAMLPKGIDHLTLEEVKSFLKTSDETEITAQLLGEHIGIGRSTARRYLEYLVSLDFAEASLNYGQIGRPQRIYNLREQNEQK